MTANHVILEISPSCLELAVVRGGSIVASLALRGDRAEWGDAWPGVLTSRSAQLARLVSQLNCTGASATVLYSGHGSVATASSCPAAASASDAREAAELALANLADFPVDLNPFDIRPILTDKPVGPPTGKPAQSHSLAVADSDERTAAIAAWVRDAGLKLDSMIPLDAIGQYHASQVATEPSSSGEVRAVLWLGSHSAALAVGRPDRLAFVRTIAIGVESLVDAIARTIRARSSEGATVTLDRSTARAIIDAVGIPPADAPIPQAPELNGSSILPMLQPVLQRLSIEAKQSVRFGVGESERARVRLIVVGPGARVRNLESALASQSGLTAAESTEPTPSASSSTPAPPSAISVTAAAGDRLPRLVPSFERNATSLRGMRRALWVGVAIAATLVTADYLTARSLLVSKTAQLAKLSAQSSNTSELVRFRDAALNARLALSAAQHRAANRLGDAPDWPAVLRVLGRLTPDSIRLATIDMARENDGHQVTLRGSVRIEAGTDPSVSIKAFIDSLSAVPLFESVRMGVSQRTTVDGHEAQSFQLTLALVALPLSAADVVSTAGDRESAR